jgi:hypothetical protein
MMENSVPIIALALLQRKDLGVICGDDSFHSDKLLTSQNICAIN